MPLNELKQVLKYAKPLEYKDGGAWYVIANKNIHDIADRYDIAFEKAAGIVAGLCHLPGKTNARVALK